MVTVAYDTAVVDTEPGEDPDWGQTKTLECSITKTGDPTEYNVTWYRNGGNITLGSR